MNEFFCNNCGTKLPSESLFCYNCGQEISAENSVKNNEQEQTVRSVPIRGKELEEKTMLLRKRATISLFNPKTKTKIVIGVTITVFLIFLIYLFNYSKAVDAANTFYMDSEYNMAEEEIKGFFPLSADDSRLFNKIKLLNLCDSNMDYFEMFEEENDMENALESLLDGYKECLDNEDVAQKYDLEFEYNSLKDDYLEKLNGYYDISEYKAGQLTKLDYTSRSKEIEKLYVKGKTISKQKQQEEAEREMRDRNPIEISDIILSSNSSYTILEGSVTNVSERTQEFVEIKGLFKDSSGNVIDTDWTYAVGSEGLGPNESTKFRMSVTKDRRIEKASVELK